MYKWFLNWFGKPEDIPEVVVELTGTIEWLCPKCGSFEKELRKEFTGVCSKCRAYYITGEFIAKPHYKWCWKQNKAIQQWTK
tara:strand:- start:305 stop:550 length:246 start_codon:yes stop_codon:yes gene_type:complete